MAIYYIDVVNGNDANTGLSWAQAWKTPTSGATAARIAPGDDIRVAKTADPTSVGTATWTDGKIGNSITFATAPTKVIDNAKAGWVTMGAGSVVSNGQTGQYMTTTTFGGTTVGALGWTTTATANGCYKDLGSTIDYSAHQQVCFWFRTSLGFDCTTTQNLLIDLCSDAGATTVVSAITAPKWNYAGGMWYPLVIDAGTALSSTVRSIRFRTTNATTQTFWVDEIFASPAGGLTLWSLIGLNNGIWYPIRSIRDADVQLLAGFTPSIANGAAGGQSASNWIIDASWMGTTTTATTWKLEPSRALLPTSGPAATFGLNNLEIATAALPRRITGGYNTSTDTVDGETWFDNVTQTGSSIGLNTVSSPHALFENFGVVRFASAVANTSDMYLNNVHFVACTNGSSLQFNPSATAVANLGIDTLRIKSITGCHGIAGYNITGTSRIQKIQYDEIWGNSLNSGVTFNYGGASALNIEVGNLSAVGQGSNAALPYLSFPSFSRVKITNYRQCNTATTGISSVNIVPFSLGRSCDVKIGTLDVKCHPNDVSSVSSANSKITIDTLKLSGGSLLGAVEDGLVCNFGSPNLTNGAVLWKTSGTTPTTPTGSKVYFHNWNGAVGEFRVYVCVFDNSNNAPYFELQATDVYTAGSKAVRFTGGNGFNNLSPMFNTRIDLKLASAAAEANKLVTVTARVKRNDTAVAAGIYIPGFTGFLPGYTTDQTVSCTSTGTFELLTVTFTPTADCVFDVMAYLTPTGAVSPNIVWDALTITQAA